MRESARQRRQFLDAILEIGGGRFLNGGKQRGEGGGESSLKCIADGLEDDPVVGFDGGA